jgi:hypothetical protein
MALTPHVGEPTLGRMDFRKRIRVIAGKRGGQPTIRGPRITVADNRLVALGRRPMSARDADPGNLAD